MAEMTVQEAKTLLTDWTEWLNDKHETWREVNLTDKEGEQIAALIEQQAAEIERQTKAIRIFMSANQSPETYRQVKAALEEKP